MNENIVQHVRVKNCRGKTMFNPVSATGIVLFYVRPHPTQLLVNLPYPSVLPKSRELLKGSLKHF